MFTNQTNSLYSSPFTSTAALYNNPTKYTTPVVDQQSIMDAYNKLEALRNNMQQSQIPQTQQQKRNVFVDINTELSELSDDEKDFIMASKEYKLADAKYQNEFSQFLITKFSDEFLQGHQRTMEDLLLAIRHRKEEYKNKFADDVAEIREHNKTLEDRNNELAKSNVELQKQLEAIQQKIGSAL